MQNPCCSVAVKKESILSRLMRTQERQAARSSDSNAPSLPSMSKRKRWTTTRAISLRGALVAVAANSAPDPPWSAPRCMHSARRDRHIFYFFGSHCCPPPLSRTTFDSVRQLAGLIEDFLEDLGSPASDMQAVSAVLLGCELGRSGLKFRV